MNPKFSKLNRTIHWMSSAFGLASLVFFSITGITLNHPDWFSVDRTISREEITLDQTWLDDFHRYDALGQLDCLATQLKSQWHLTVPSNIDHDEYEWVLDYQRPGGVTSVVLDLESGLLSMEREDDGLVSLINNLHKGRHAGLVWSVLLDVTAIICILFSVTGLVLLFIHAKKRSSTWPLVTAGILLPFVLYWVFVP